MGEEWIFMIGPGARVFMRAGQELFEQDAPRFRLEGDTVVCEMSGRFNPPLAVEGIHVMKLKEEGVSDSKFKFDELQRQMTEYLYKQTPSVEVRADGDWNVVRVFDSTIGEEVSYHRAGSDVLELSNSMLTVRRKIREWIPNETAAAELRALMDSWRARGWDELAAQVEEDADGESVYGELGQSVTRGEMRFYPLSNCRFLREEEYQSIFGFMQLMSGDNLYFINGRNAPITGLSPFGLEDEAPASAEGEPPPGDLVFMPETPVAVIPPNWQKYVGVDYGARRTARSEFQIRDELADLPYEDDLDAPAAASCPINPCNCPPEEASEEGHYWKKHRAEVMGGGAPETWTCDNHPHGFEITYPATVEACEVCGRGKSG